LIRIMATRGQRGQDQVTPLETAMTILVKDTGFCADDFAGVFLPLPALSPAARAETGLAVDIADPVQALDNWARIAGVVRNVDLVRVCLRDFGDTAALALAQRLRKGGYTGRLRAHGAVLARQFTLLRRAGFCEVELTAEQAQLQPPEHWLNRRDWVPRGGDAESASHCAPEM
jgi:uncharacterized protein (DUF934 family)